MRRKLKVSGIFLRLQEYPLEVRCTLKHTASRTIHDNATIDRANTPCTTVLYLAACKPKSLNNHDVHSNEISAEEAKFSVVTYVKTIQRSFLRYGHANGILLHCRMIGKVNTPGPTECPATLYSTSNSKICYASVGGVLNDIISP